MEPGMRKLPFSAAVLKWIALITMIIDHVGASFLKYYFIAHGKYEPLKTTYEVLRDIGRIAFPIYIFLLLEGYIHTRNVTKYLLRLGIFALISEIPFDLAFYNEVFHWDKQNVFFTLFIGLVTVHAMDSIASRGGMESARGGPMKEKHLPPLYFVLCDIGLVAAAAGLAYFMKTDYNGIGVCAICAVYLLRKYRLTGALACAVILMASSDREIFAIAAIIPISLYNGKKGKQLKYFFYLAYPVHLLILYLLRIPFGI
ncbi:MAG: conjugal transfer protein TraX [Lachnospiraceae bacterium]|nr:conjugal transfer protein TraX [Lachnospiraceae bacterium]